MKHLLMEPLFFTLLFLSDLFLAGPRPGLGCLPLHFDLLYPGFSLFGLALQLGHPLFSLSCLPIKVSGTPLCIQDFLLGRLGSLVSLFSYMSRLILHFLSLFSQVLHFLL